MINPKKRTSFFVYLAVAIVSTWQLITMKESDFATIAEPVKNCTGLEVKSIDLAKLRETKPKPEKAKILLPQESTTTDSINKTLNVVAIGPVLGSMDSSEFRTDLDCTPQGFILTTTIIRSANFNGAVRQNINWHPRIETTVELLEPKIVVETKWIMVSSTGALINNAKTPPFTENQQYPIIVKETIK